MKLILLVFVQSCLTALVFSDDPQKCGEDYEKCPSGYECDYDKCVKVEPPSTTTTKKPTTRKPTQCCWVGNGHRNCYTCNPSFTCVAGFYCYDPQTRPTTTLKPTHCKNDNECPVAYMCEKGLCVPSTQCCWSGNNFRNCFTCNPPFECKGYYCYNPITVPPTTTLKPTPCKNNSDCPSGYKCENKLCAWIPTKCCWRGNHWRHCYTCFPPTKCIQGNYCYRPPTRPTTTLKPTPCKNDNQCPSKYKCENELCVPKPTQCCWSGNRGINCYLCEPSLSCYKGSYCEYKPPTCMFVPPGFTTETPSPSTKKCCLGGIHNVSCYNCPEGLECYKGECCYLPTAETTTKPTMKPTTTPQPTPPTTTTTQPPTTYKPCGENKDCPGGSKCEYDVCVQDY